MRPKHRPRSYAISQVLSAGRQWQLASCEGRLVEEVFVKVRLGVDSSDRARALLSTARGLDSTTRGETSCVFPATYAHSLWACLLHPRFSPLPKKSHEGLTPLQVSAAAGHAEACTTLLRALPAPGTRAAVLAAATDGEDPSSGETALHLACLEGHTGCVQAILDEV